ncbi:MAG: PhoX family phosphatase [Methylibium sp.]|uniref:PhoX family protein n=1 Tax=Methylibium sp. TaxID=2067992 RepID=UPI00181BA028|nr:PhoX family phosphatase [Methylibium sp.]MBA3598330.1 PhoX family phosphatase [Methylibium sp.]
MADPVNAVGNVFDDLVAARIGRRELLGGSLGAAALGFLNGCGLTPTAQRGPLIGFASIPISRIDTVVVPEGYTWQVVNAWGDPIMVGAPAFEIDASQSAAVQAMQSGMFHDGMHFFPLPRGSSSSTHGLIGINYEYTDDNLLTTDGMANWSAEKVQKSKNAHGLGVYEARLEDGRWRTVADSRFGRRITADTPFRIKGPAAGHPLMQTAEDRNGTRVRGTFQNCANGYTPWGTYLSCEENFTAYFANDSGSIPRLQDRYGVPTTKDGWGFRWHEFDERFNAVKHPNESNRFGWVVEFDPYDPKSEPVKHTAMGRMAHEGAALSVADDGRVVYYMGDDDYRSKFEHIYKFVSKQPYRKGGGAAQNATVLDEGTLYAGRFNADGSGEWIELVQGKNGLTAERGFHSQAEVVIDARTAGDVVGATYMDRPEWLAVHPRSKEVYVTLSNNSSRGKGKPLHQTEPLGADAANPRAPNIMGHIVRWRETGGDPAATTFKWDVFLQAGEPTHKDALKRGNVKGGVAFAQPDGCHIDARGVLWIQTDSSAQSMATADWALLGNNQMVAADPTTGEVRRFLTGPVGCEVTAVQLTPDLRTMFINIQHPGEAPLAHPGRNDPSKPKAISSWPDGEAGGRPRSATIAIRRKDGGIVGT